MEVNSKGLKSADMPDLESKGGDRCLFLDLLPAETRNNIYELVYTNDTSKDNKVDLLKAKPPSNSLIRTCRQIHNEAAAFYKPSYRDFWSHSYFTLRVSHREDFKCDLHHLRSEDLQNITRLKLCLRTSLSRRYYDLICVNGWRAYYMIEPTKRVEKYWYYETGLDGYPAWESFDSKRALISFHEYAPLDQHTDLAYQIQYLMEPYRAISLWLDD
ncbi:hypothetical protein BST61_g7627 [Cercospora zeina]